MTTTATLEAEEARTLSAAKVGKYLTFNLGDEVYGLEILKVQEIIGLMNITGVPKTPEYVRGVINLRGIVVPVIELRAKFGMHLTEDTDRTCIVVARVSTDSGQIIIGILVDEVSEVQDVNVGQLEPPPSIGFASDTSFILAMAKIEDKVVMLLDVDAVLSTDEMALVSSFNR